PDDRRRGRLGGLGTVERGTDVVDDDARALGCKTQRELSADAAPRTGDDGDSTVEQAHDGQATAQVAAPRTASLPLSEVTTRSRSASCSPPSSRTPVTVARAVSTSPGHTCFAKRTWNRRTDSGPNQSVSTRPARPIVSIPCPNTDGLPTWEAIV